MFKRAVKAVLSSLEYVPDNFKIQKMCDDVVKKCLWLLERVPNWFVTKGKKKLWHDDAYYCIDDELIEWYNGYQKRKAQKA